MPAEQITQIQVKPIDVLMISILVQYLGIYLTRKIRLLRDYYIPPAVTGGLICSGIIALIYVYQGVEISFDMQIRDVLLLVFFSTIGLSAKLSTLAAGGKALAVMVVVAGLFLVIQNATGVGLVTLAGGHPGYGLFAGSVSFAGGHGTAIAWGAEAEAAGLDKASVVGIAFATFGLIGGGLLGGPVARGLINRYKLKGGSTAVEGGSEDKPVATGNPASLSNLLGAILLLAICVESGDLVNRVLFEKGVLLPGFLTSMFVGILLTNLADLIRLRINLHTINKFGEVSLALFLAMSLMSMQLWSLAGAAGAVFFIMILQMLVMTLFTTLIVFRVMGKDYDAAVMAAGFVGLGLGATPVAIANMSAVTARFGHSAKALLVIPLVGAFFIDLLNALVIKFYINVITNWLG